MVSTALDSKAGRCVAEYTLKGVHAGEDVTRYGWHETLLCQRDATKRDAVTRALRTPIAGCARCSVFGGTVLAQDACAFECCVL